MKDATGELSMTAIAVVAIAAIALLFRSFIWPGIQANIQRNTYCSQAHNCTCGGSGSSSTSCNCQYYDDAGNEKTIKCPNNQKQVTA
jgi:hypothetical protein